MNDIEKTNKWLCDYLVLSDEQSAMVLEELKGLRIAAIKECVEAAKDVQEESWSFKPKFNVAINECVSRLEKLAQP